jgi:glycosyltransferase involved in cell wall biosynthesis
VSRVLLLTFTDLSRDPRVRRHVEALRGEHEIVTCARGTPPDGVASHVQLPEHADHMPLSPAGVAALLAGRNATAYERVPAVRETRAALTGADFDVLVANDAVTLPVGLEVAGDRPVVADLHEYAPLEMEEDWRWRLLFQRFAHWICTTYLPSAAAVTTVSPGLADRYRQEFGVDAHVVTNAGPTRNSTGNRPTGRPIRVVHSGNANPNRGIEVMIEAAAGLDGVQLDLFLVPAPRTGRYLHRLKAIANAAPNVRVLDPVPMDQVVAAMETYDVGLYALQPTSFNNLHALPNKFFDFVQAGLAVVIGPSPDMAELVRQHDLGLVARGFDQHSVRLALKELTTTAVDRWRKNVRSSRGLLSSERQADVLRSVIQEVLASGSP